MCYFFSSAHRPAFHSSDATVRTLAPADVAVMAALCCEGGSLWQDRLFPVIQVSVRCCLLRWRLVAVCACVCVCVCVCVLCVCVFVCCACACVCVCGPGVCESDIG